MATEIKKILVPLDGSKNSIRALDMAIHIARQSHETITALSIKPVPGIYAIHPLGFLDFNSISEIKKLLESAKVRAAKKGIQLTGKMIVGEPGQDIAQFANNVKNKIDLVVMGNRGRSSAKEIFLGSTSNHVLHKSKKPVLIVK
ncbi:MAG: universal stress protein [Nitrosopumilus sp.]|jgi:nucleotide-binding universal stress UspA family protein|nr:universal stress protein [Nitrosopumilus sp.]MBT3573842.1 universal stress protein [Nitrosopumilus sp.]MBT3861295.1 universal stress protein [Nitrosopumilus sp.]MBT3956194.1 universal stress protein [Nitrosopumilus sp.]MBT4298586.1 universal stress protein [Nitrosopumilus sp.]